MASKTWTFRLEDGDHTVQLDHNLWSGKRTVVVDGRSLVDETKKFNLVSDYPFDIRGHKGLVRIRSNGIAYNYDVAIDGKSVTTGKPALAAASMPAWGWAFVIVCVLIPVVSLGGIVPAVIGVGGAIICSVIARDASKEASTRVAICLGVTVLCWGVFIGFALLVAGLTNR